MREWHNQSHVRWYCRYHIVIVPTDRQKAIFGTLRQDIGKSLRERCKQMGIELVEGHAMPEQVHVCRSIPPQDSVANAVGRWKGKAAIRIHRAYLGRTRHFTGLHFWARGDGVSTVGFDEAVIRQDIRNQEEQEQRAAQLALGDCAPRKSGKHTHGAGPGSASAPWGGLLQPCPRRGPPATAPPAGACHHRALCRGLPTTAPPVGAYQTAPPFRGASSNHPLCGW
jgi:REP-associated tyrosine transposase